MGGRPGSDEIVEDAIAATGITDVGDDWFMAPLALWASDPEQPNLTDRGRRFLRSLAVREISQRLRVLDTLREHPEINEVEIPPIVYITGLERSGTTVLHNLVALHRSSRALLRWELMEPIPPPTTASFCMPTSGRFISEADQTPAFEHYRQLVQLLTWQHPVEPGGFLVLKAPQIALHIDVFADVFPEAHFVVTDRDPFRALVSVAVLGRSIVEPFCVVNPITHPGPDDVDLAVSVQKKLAAVLAFTDAHPDRIEHLAYPDLVGDPAPAVTGLLDAIGVADDPGLADRVDAFLAAQRAGRRSAPPPSLDTLGYEHDEVLAQPEIARYCARLGIEPERHRLTGAS